MNYKKTALQREAEKIRMRGAERRALKERVLSYMSYHPLPRGHAVAETPKPVWNFFGIERIYRRPLVGALAVLLIIGVPVAAEQAMPGDALYPVKVRFNEEVRATLTFSPYEKIAWETRRVERRVAEARLLASEGKLTEETEAEIKETVQAHTDAAQRELETLRASDAEEAAIAQIALESALDVQSAVLSTDIAANGTTTVPGESVAGLAEAVRAAKADVTANVEEGTLSFARLYDAVNGALTLAHERFATLGEAASLDEHRAIEEKLKEIKEEVEGARMLHEEGAETDGQAAGLLRASLSRIQKLSTFMTNINVRNSVTLETLLPEQVEGDRERVAALTAVLDRAARVHDAVLAEVDGVEDETLRGEITLELENLERLVEDAARMVILGELESAELLMEDITTATTELIEHSNITDPDLVEPEGGTSTSTDAADSGVLGEATSTPPLEGASTVATSTDATSTREL